MPKDHNLTKSSPCTTLSNAFKYITSVCAFEPKDLYILSKKTSNCCIVECFFLKPNCDEDIELETKGMILLFIIFRDYAHANMDNASA